jgi:outer membrane protein assembly factor BamE (lipoprotein component of BamABCDE complex)
VTRPAIPRTAGRLAALGGVLLVVASCSLFLPPTEVRGNKVDADELKQLVPGTTTQADATSLLGSPTAKGSFDPNEWFYISELTRPIIGGTQTVVQQAVVMLTFNSQGVLQHVETLNQHDAYSVPIVSRTTPSPGTNASFLQQLLGNVGRFTPAAGPTPGPGGGAPTQ